MRHKTAHAAAVATLLSLACSRGTPAPSTAPVGPKATAAPAAAGQPGSVAEPLFVYVKIPAEIGPLERAERFEDPLNERLQAEGLGEVTGGGSSLSEPDAAGKRRIEYCGIDVDLTNPAKGLELLRKELVRLRVPQGTVLQYTKDGREHEDLLYAAEVTSRPRKAAAP